MAFLDNWRQIWAIMRRHGIIVCRKPIRNFLKMIAWPGILIGLLIYILNKTIDPQPAKKEAITASFIQFAPRFALITTIFHAASYGELLILDKATSMKSLMISSGLKQMNYYCANSICSLMFLLPLSMTLAAVTKVYLFDGTITWFALLGLLALFALHLDSFIMFMVSFITSPKYSILIPLVLFFNNVLDWLTQVLIGQLGDGMRPLILFLISMSPFEPLNLFYNGYLVDHNSIPDKPPLTQERYLIFTAQIVAIIFYRLFAFWFEEVCPWQTNPAPRSACFCVDKENKRYTEQPLEESDKRDDPMFESIDSGQREIGISIKKATKKFDNIAAVSDVSFSIYKGEATLLLGHNGAGKSTLMNMILGLLKPDSGRVRIRTVNGRVNSLGVCPQTSVLDESLDVRQHLELFNDIKSNLSGTERKTHIQQTIDDISLSESAKKLPAELSGGMKRKLSLGIALVGKSEVLILDEPSSGLDPDSRTFIWNAIRRYRRGRTVLLSTQHMEEADYLGDRIAIMNAGHIVCCGSSIFLNRLFGSGYKLRVECPMSKRLQVLNHIKVHFPKAHPVEENEFSTPRASGTADVVLDFVVELETSEEESRAEMQLIELLEDLENNKAQIGVLSYGLKSSSIEDVMLRTSQKFGKVARRDEYHLPMATSTHKHLDTLTRTRANLIYESKLGGVSRVLLALVMKQLHAYRANWFTVLVLKLLLPLAGTWNAVSSAKTPLNMDGYWQSPVHVLMVGHFIYFPIRERVSKFKIMQLNTDLKTHLYWLSFTLVDIVFALISLVSINIILMSWFNVEVLVPGWQLHGVVSAATFLFCLASMMFCYLLSNAISDPKTAYGYIVIVFSLSTAAYIVIYLLRLALFEGGRTWIQNVSNYVGVAMLPNDAYSQVYVGLYTHCYLAAAQNRTCIVADAWSPVSIGLTTLAIQVVIYGTLLGIVECQVLNFEYYLRFENICRCFYRKQNHTSTELPPDEDVQKETAKARGLIEAPFAGASCLVVAGLHKSYTRSLKVIRDLSFTVQKGECFGLLGVNGAGKSTTFSMLCGDSRPDAGRILADGTYSDKELDRYRAKFGYDPQSSPEMSLTAHQALRLMAKLRGVRETQLDGQVRAVLELLNMAEHEHKLDWELSGGTKRKLALGMALIGSPRLLALDEPTAGVDPLARRSVWHLLKSLQSQNEVSIIISSHAMEECEAICDRITIMARGRLRCIGTFLHLRSKFARGCSLRVVFSSSNRSHSEGRSEGRAGAGHNKPGVLELARKATSHNLKKGARGGKNSKSDEKIHRAPQEAGPDASHSRGRSAGRPDTPADQPTGPDGVSETVARELQEMLAAAIGRNTFKLADRNNNSLTFDVVDNRVRRSILFRMMRDFKLKHPNSSYSINDSSLEDIFILLAKEDKERN